MVAKAVSRVFVCVSLALLACDDDIKDVDTSDGGTADGGSSSDVDGSSGAALPPKSDLFGEGEEPGGLNDAVVAACVPYSDALDTDYAPGAADRWPACMSDDGKFHPIDPNISASARTQAFEDIGALLFNADKDATREQFLQARMIYDEDEGLGSRLVRRYDPHYAPKGSADCTKEADIAANPDYCSGPAKMQRIVQMSLKSGFDGVEPRWHAGRIEGALLWFSAASEFKETLSCSEVIKDCDSAYGYYDGAGKGIGLGGYIRKVDPQADALATNGALAVSCWRELDRAVPATNLTLREQARNQFDRGVLKGAVSVLRARIDAAHKASGKGQLYHWGFVTSFLGAVESQAERAKGAATILKQARDARGPSEVDVDALKATLDAIASCKS